MVNPFDAVTLKIWHGGVFKNVANGALIYEGGRGRTFEVDPDELCYWDLIDLGKKCGEYRKIEGVSYLIPNLTLVNGLRKVINDKDCLELANLASKFRCVEVYLLHGLDEPPLA